MRNCIVSLIMGLVICTELTGCTVNRVSMLPPQHSGTDVKANDVRFLPTIREIKAPWTIEGMISAYTLPTASNSAEKRERLIKDEAAGQGISTVVGLQSLTGKGHANISNGILVGTRLTENRNRPKFIAFLPPVNFRIESTVAMRELDDRLREHIQYFLSYTRGYYVHRWDPPNIDSVRMMQGAIDPDLLLRPLGMMPDFILLCDVDGYDEEGNVVTKQAKTLKIALTLMDLEERKIFWTSAGSGKVSQSLLLGAITFGPLFSWSGLLTESEELSFMVRKAVLETIDTLPAVPGFRPGHISPVDRK